MADSISFEADLSNVQRADNGETTYYGGSYVLDGVERPARGDDRSTGSWFDELVELVVARCKAEWPDFEPDLLYEEMLEVEAGLESGTFVVQRDGSVHF